MKGPSLLLVLCTCPLLSQADTLRCGSKLVNLGDRTFEVLEKCGEPTYRDPVGYTLGPYNRRETPIEEWAYQPSNGMFSILTFEGNRLTRIERKRSR
ncbi:DUF2845 domain-containing protein [Phytopseudomonas dryadis]|uniref:DUF2845 domain-containing protein n=1 Tax=Phytopseudomonas dryadis TaxID=2487520 RepID=A0A4Q9R7U1_9GAMM|nr:DUF2845 domain-containing protein [Pseudomonas dryadis]TBU96688.1 hypothetical protein DNK44_03450 [Pseudomonas dryadis]